MPTQCVPGFRCGAALSGWLNGGHPTLADGEVSLQWSALPEVEIVTRDQ